MKMIVLRNGEAISAVKLADKLLETIKEMDDREVLFLHFQIVDLFNPRQYIEACRLLEYNKCVEVLDAFGYMKEQLMRGNISEAKFLVEVAVQISNTALSLTKQMYGKYL